VHGVDGSLDLVRARTALAQAAADQRLALGDKLPVPPATVLIGEEYQVPAGIRAGGTAGLGLPSAYGPSVTSTSPSRTRTTVDASGPCSPPSKTHTPAAFISSFSTARSRMIGSRISGAGGSPTGWCMASM